ncbi:hypothetical protein Back11_02040 [Paenibacillus baekrokdamisoli]|uniref:L-fucose isomerase C-terminal domain-containing protein n=1 Tax=Paenibacillus baekrokdamisoli TaxID=1712516 RepID=A0A3G9J7B5_9BACL|nr:hypothetical protein [Paenibacillus baekrokdamisoli]MBB3069166.1 L-arabinose isomerase [Paenibacillus baekrokdamisoli]BBH18859.1 hypothetical protein Back11_02040 [Paenibacillus baekrokdamisoli]
MTELIESFETAKGNVFGDLLTTRVKDKPLKVGLITLGFFEYWRMFPDTLKANVTADMTCIYDHLRQYLNQDEVIWSGIIDTLDAAEAAGQELASQRVDLIVYVAGTYCPDYMAIQALEHVRHVPVILFNTQHNNKINLGTNYENILRNSALIANLQLAATFKKMGWYRDLKVVVGSIQDIAAYEEMTKYIRAYKAYISLKSTNIGVIGHVFRGMYDFEYDKTMIKGTLGPNIISIQVDHLLDQFGKATEEEIEAIVEQTTNRFNIVGLNEDDIYKSSRFYVALRNTLERFRLDALTLLGQHYVEQKTGTTSYLANTMMHEEGKYVVNTEGDVHGLIIMTLMNMLSGQVPAYAEWGEYDEELNALLMVHHGYADTDYATDKSTVKVNRSPEQWGLQGAGFGFEYTLKPGEVTISHLIIDAEGYKMLIVKGEALHIPQNIPCEEITAVVKFHTPIKQFLAALIKEGFAHHCIIGYGDLTEELSNVADFMGIRKVIY